VTLLVIFLILLPFGIGAVIGAPYLPILQRDSKALLDLCGLSPGQTIVDLGSGDGRFLRAAAKLGFRGIGYEINPLLVVISRLVTWRYRHLVTIRLADFWRTPLPPCDAVYVFLIERLMPQLNTKLERELTRSTPVISFVFEIPGRQPIARLRNAAKYIYGA
jgi:SAM-dependent methyltransferase